MTTDKEREVIQIQTKSIIRDACGEDRDAAEYLWMIARITRTLDDIYDADQEVTREDMLEVLEYLFVKLPTNSFFNKNQAILLSQHLSMYNAWMAANLAENGDETDKIYAHVWRDTHHELIPIVAMLTQGYKKMQLVSLHIRRIFKNKLGD
jgi:hypothetical protein